MNILNFVINIYFNMTDYFDQFNMLIKCPTFVMDIINDTTSAFNSENFNNNQRIDLHNKTNFFKTIIMDYVANDYYFFNNNDSYIFNINNLIQFVSIIFVNIEALLLGFQKIIQEIFGYIFDLCN